MRKKRQKFDKKLCSDIAHAYVNGTITVAEIEAKGIRMGNVYKWIKRFVTNSKAPEPSAAPVVESAKSESTATIVDIRTLTKKQLKRGDNGRYLPIVKDSVVAALKTMTVPEVAEITGITEATLYLWKTPKPAKKRPSQIPATTALVPVNGARPTTDVVPMRRAELIFNPESTEAMLTSIRKSEGFANLDKAAKQLKAAFRSGLIDDYDEIDLRVLLGHRQLTGGGLRQRK